MKEKILSELKTKYKNMGLSDETYEGVANQLALSVKEETEIATAVSGAEGLLKSIQKYADSRVTSLKTETEVLKNKLKEIEEKGKPGDEASKGDDDTPAWAKALIDSNSKLEQKLSKLEGEKTHESLNAKLLGTLSEKKIPESFYSPALFGRTFSSDEDVTKIAETISTSFEKYQQDLANAGGVTPERGKGAPEGDSKEIAKMIESGTKDIVESKK